MHHPDFGFYQAVPTHSASWPRPPPYPHSRVVLGQVNTLPMHCAPYPPSSGALAAGTPNLHWQRRLHSCPHSGEAALRTLSPCSTGAVDSSTSIPLQIKAYGLVT